MSPKLRIKAVKSGIRIQSLSLPKVCAHSIRRAAKFLLLKRAVKIRRAGKRLSDSLLLLPLLWLSLAQGLWKCQKWHLCSWHPLIPKIANLHINFHILEDVNPVYYCWCVREGGLGTNHVIWIWTLYSWVGSNWTAVAIGGQKSQIADF